VYFTRSTIALAPFAADGFGRQMFENQQKGFSK
jgi:hypothetical protein